MENREREMLDELRDMAEEIQVPEGLTPECCREEASGSGRAEACKKAAPHFDSRACGGMLPACMRGCLQDMEPAECGRPGKASLLQKTGRRTA